MKLNWRFKLGSLLIISSIIIYITHGVVFKDPYFTFKLFYGQLGFLPFSVFVMAFIINKFIAIREKKQKEEKSYMLLGVFFSEIGSKLIKHYNSLNNEKEIISKIANKPESWSEENLKIIQKDFEDSKIDIKIDNEDLLKLKNILNVEKDFLLNLLQNPALMEHDVISHTVWAVLHVYEELNILDDIEKVDKTHIKGDIERSFRALNRLWVRYMIHLKKNFPFLHSLAVRTNPYSI